MNLIHLSDDAWVSQAKRGDQEAFRMLFERHSRSVFRLAYSMTGTAEHAEDLVQETFVRAFQQLAKFEGRSKFSTWLRRIAFNCAIDHIRSRRSREVPQPSEVLDGLVNSATGGIAGDDAVLAGEIKTQIQAALSDLSERERWAFCLRHRYGYSIDEICAAIGLTRNAAKHSVFRAVRKIRMRLKPLRRPAQGQ